MNWKLTRQAAYSEHNLQRAIINELRRQHFYCFAIPNGGQRDAKTGKKLKDEGVLAGVADFEIILEHGRCVFVEVKTPWGYQSPVQKAFEQEIKLRGTEYYIWRSVNDAKEFIKNELKCGNVQTTGADVSAFTSTPPTLNAE